MPGDTRNKRTSLQRKQDRVKIARMYIRKTSQIEIARELGLSQQQISSDLKKIQQEWQKNTAIDLDKHKAETLAKIDHLEQTYWTEWEESRKEIKTKTLKTKDATQTKTLKAVERLGDPRYLDGIQKCIEQRCKILGIYQQADVSGLVINLVSSKEVNLDNC